VADPIASIGTTASDATAFVDRLFRKADANHDGHVTREEFGAYLSQAIATARAAGTAASTSGSSGATSTTSSGVTHGGR
jgi:hypothetical protein